MDLRATLCRFPPNPPTLSKPLTPWMRPGPTVAMSMEAVASSMMKMLVFLTKARARQNSCLWPWLKFSPPSVMMASESSPRRGAGLSESWVVRRADSVAWERGLRKCLYRSECVSMCGEYKCVGLPSLTQPHGCHLHGFNEKSTPWSVCCWGAGQFREGVCTECALRGRRPWWRDSLKPRRGWPLLPKGLQQMQRSWGGRSPRSLQECPVLVIPQMVLSSLFPELGRQVDREGRE